MGMKGRGVRTVDAERENKELEKTVGTWKLEKAETQCQEEGTWSASKGAKAGTWERNTIA